MLTRAAKHKIINPDLIRLEKRERIQDQGQKKKKGWGGDGTPKDMLSILSGCGHTNKRHVGYSRMKGDSPQQPCYVKSEDWRSCNYSLARPAAAGFGWRCSATTSTRLLNAGWPCLKVSERSF